MARSGLKFKRLRLFLELCRNCLYGWVFRFASIRPQPFVSEVWPYSLADYVCDIKRRPELGEQNENRVDNMRLACTRINGSLLAPGEIFSLQRALGEPSLERGYKNGPMLLKGKLAAIPGGGLCQVSTVLFNAALLAGLRILEKHNHTMDVWGERRFVDLGRDAVYVYARKDLKFANCHPFPILISLSVEEAGEALALRGRVLAPQPLREVISVESMVIAELPPSCSKICTRGRPITGWVVETVRRLCSQGQSRITYRRREVYRPGFFPE